MHKIFLTLLWMLTLLSCDRIKRKGNMVVDKTKETAAKSRQKIADKKNQLVDKIFPSYDSDKPDTKSNIKRFKEHLQVDPGSDVKNIYAYGDFFGVDYKLLLAFSCDQTTIDTIIAVKKMKRSGKDDDGLFFLHDLEWWKQDSMTMPAPYKAGKDAEWWEYLWYDPKSKQAFYEEYSL